MLDAALGWRYLTASAGAGVMIVTVCLVLSGRPGFRFVPALEADVISASMTMPQGSPVEATGEAIARLEAGAARLRQAPARGDQDHFVHVLAVVGDQPMAARGGGSRYTGGGEARSDIDVQLAGPDLGRLRRTPWAQPGGVGRATRTKISQRGFASDRQDM